MKHIAFGLCTSTLFLLVGLTMPAAGQTKSGWSAESGFHMEKLERRGLLNQRRKVFYYVPRELRTDEPVPIVIALHGGRSNPRNIRLRSGLSALAEREKLVAVYPQGNGILNLLLHWNAGFCCAAAMEKGIDDVAFIMDAVDNLAEVLPVDRSRVYAFGFSNGAMLAHQLAAREPQRIAAIAAVSGNVGRRLSSGAADFQLEPPSGGVPVMIVHGAEDPRLPIQGRPIKAGQNVEEAFGTLPVIEGARFWARTNGCIREELQSAPFDNVELIRWSQCTTTKPVVMYRLAGWGHRWAGQSPHTRADYTQVGGFETVEVIWDFFRDHRAPLASGVNH